MASASHEDLSSTFAVGQFGPGMVLTVNAPLKNPSCGGIMFSTPACIQGFNGNMHASLKVPHVQIKLFDA